METGSDSGAALMSWSSGKDCAWALHLLRQSGTNVTGLLTTFNIAFNRVAMHSTRRDVVEEQARELGLPLWPVELPWPCSNENYERIMADVMLRAKTEGVTHVAFGDLYLEDIRRYREEKLAPLGIQSLFPIWTTRERAPMLAREMLGAGLRAKVTSVDPKQIDPSFVGREYDKTFLADLPKKADPCGENGEFHTVAYAGPMFKRPLCLEPGEIVERDGFWFADFKLISGVSSPAG